MQNKTILGYVAISLSILISIYFCINPKTLIPGGYDLAIDGYVISRTLIFIFTLNLLFKLGNLLINKKD